MAASLDSPEYAKALGVLKEVLPEGLDPSTIWTALQDAGLTISEAEAGPPPEMPEEAALSGAPVDGEPQGAGDGMDIGNGPPTDDLVRKAFRASMAESTK